MVELSFHFTLELTEEQKHQLKMYRRFAKNDNGAIIAFLKDNEIDGYIIPEYKVKLINNFLDARSKSNAPLKKPKFDLIATQDKLLDETKTTEEKD